MSSVTPNISVCRHCLHYQVEGRRGGTCQQLGVPVQAQWHACPLAAPFFATSRIQPAEVTPLPTPVLEVVPVLPLADHPTPAEVIPITGITRRSALRSPSLMA